MTKGVAWCWLPLLALVLAGCSSEEAGAQRSLGGDPYGGQTGSLRPVRPTCGVAPSFQAAPTLPAGDTVFVYYDDGCVADASDFVLTDEEGNIVPVEVERLAGGGLAVRSDQALTPGSYQIETPSETKTVVVSESEPLPSSLGTLTALDGCFASVLLRFDDAVKPYLPLLALSYRIDGGSLEPWYDYGLIPAGSDELELSLAWCPGPCRRDGVFQVEVVANIAGETMGPDPVSQSVTQSCSASSGDGDGGGTGCSVARPWAFGSVSRTCLLLGLLLVGWRRRGSGSRT